MTKEIEKAGITIVQMANLVPVALTVGSNRIVPTISIPYPLGDPATTSKEQFKLRCDRVGVAFDDLSKNKKEKMVLKVK